jgi:hypothetical protein
MRSLRATCGREWPPIAARPQLSESGNERSGSRALARVPKQARGARLTGLSLVGATELRARLLFGRSLYSGAVARASASWRIVNTTSPWSLDVAIGSRPRVGATAGPIAGINFGRKSRGNAALSLELPDDAVRPPVAAVTWSRTLVDWEPGRPSVGCLCACSRGFVTTGSGRLRRRTCPSVRPYR